MSEDLKHFGVKGMKWGVRRHQPYQKGDGPKGKFIDAHKRADASKQARRDRTETKRVSRGKALDAKFSKFTDAHKKADATKDARRAKQDARLKVVKDRENAQGKAAASKVKKAVGKTSSKISSSNERLLKKSKSFKADYDKVRESGISHDKALKAARVTRIVKQAATVSVAKEVADAVYRKNYRNIYLGKQATESFNRVVVKPRAAAFGKNIVNTMTGNPVKSIVNPPKGVDVTSALYKGMSIVVQN